MEADRTAWPRPQRSRSALARVLADLAARHRGRLVLTYGLTLVEKTCYVFYPLLTGVAIDGLLAGRWGGVVGFMALGLVHLGVGAARHLYDSRAFSLVHNDLVVRTVRMQRGRDVDHATIAARIGLSGELIDFLQVEVPVSVSHATVIVGSVAMLFVLDAPLGVVALLAVVAIAYTSVRFGQASLRLNGGLNNRLEKQVSILTTQPIEQVARHVERVRAWRILLSNAEAVAWAALRFVVLVLAIVALVRLTGQDGATPGAIYAALAYVWELYRVVNDLPYVVQNAARVADISKRLAEGA